MKNVLKTDTEVVVFCDTLRDKLVDHGIDLAKNKEAFSYFLAKTVAALRCDPGFILLFADNSDELRLLSGSGEVLSAGVNFSGVYYDFNGQSSEESIVDKGLAAVKSGKMPCLFEFFYPDEWVKVHDYLELNADQKGWDCSWQRMEDICKEVISIFHE